MPINSSIDRIKSSNLGYPRSELQSSISLPAFIGNEREIESDGVVAPRGYRVISIFVTDEWACEAD